MSKEDDCHRQDAPGFLLQRGTKLFGRLVERALEGSGLAYSDMPVLLQLRMQGPLLQRDLVRQAMIGQPAMVGTLTRLERAGMIERRPLERDRRASLIMLTTKGRKAAEMGAVALEQVNAMALTGMTDAERSETASLMRRLIANMEA